MAKPLSHRRGASRPPSPDPIASSSKPTSLTLSTFEEGFDIAELINGLTESALQQSQQEGGEFDAAPFINIFEAAVDQLIPLRNQVSARATEHEAIVSKAERQYTSKLKELKENFEAVSTSFNSLESRISEVGRTAIRIGEQLESVDKLKSRAAESHDLITYYFDFARGDTSKLEQIRKEEGREGRAKVAVIARRLAILAKEVETMEGGEETRASIDKYCERFEKDMLKLFDRYYRKGDPKMMAHCAQTLLDFNGGQSCIQVYVNQHDFFISKDRILEGSSLIDPATLDQLPDPDMPAPKSEPKLAALFNEIRTTVDQEAQIIQAVFPQPAVVMQVFLQRVFAQVIQTYIENLLASASNSTALAFLRILHLAHQTTHSLVDDLKSHDFFKSASVFSSAQANRNSTVPAEHSAQTNLAPGTGVAAVNLMLDQAYDELFSPYIEGVRYLEKESKNLTELHSGYLLKFLNFHQLTNKSKTTKSVFDRVVNQVQTSLANTAISNPSGSPNLGQQDSSRAMRVFTKLSGVTSSNGDKQPEIQVDPNDGLLKLEVAERMLRWHAEAVGRMVELSAPSDVPKNAFTLMKELADNFGRVYIETALDTALTQVAAYENKSEPDLGILSVIRQADLVMTLWQKYLSIALFSLAASSVTVRREMGIFNNHVVIRIEGKTNELIQKLTDNIVAWLYNILQRQKKTDFKPKNDDLAFASTNTEPCIGCCDFLAKIHEQATANLSGKNCESFLTEVGVAFHALLLDHLKKYPVSATGGLILTKDLAVYQDTMNGYQIAIITDRFDMLRQLGNIFIVRPEIIKSYMSESHLARVDGALLRPFLMQRSDYQQYSRKVWDDIAPPSETASASNTMGMAYGFHFGL